ncbi:MAG: tripartite tricarboxylate transporter substrate binding protein, partial [Betaproteobacteria bacterium]|nr:tripartite tricarboxylate transporter substrate binding protein [Betaproteobacteria bacterium]
MNIQRIFKAAVAVCAAVTMGGLHAQSFPNKTISLVVPYPAGGPSDFFARKVQPDAAAKLGQTMIVDNVGGAGGTIALNKVLNAPADGHTVALGSPMELVLAPMAIQGVKYKAEDFKLVAQFSSTSTILAVRTSMNVKSVDDLIALAKKHPDQPLTYGSVGHGSLYHLIGEKFGQISKAPMLHVPYKG